MHDYLRAVGWSNLRDHQELNEILDKVSQYPTSQCSKTKEDGTVLMEYSREYANDLGIVVRGELDQKGQFHREYYFPYFLGNSTPIEDKATIIKYAEKEVYSGLVLDLNDTMTLVFYLQNALEYLSEHDSHLEDKTACFSSLSGLSVEGKILIPILSSVEEMDTEMDPISDKSRLIEAAKNGDQKAIERLTIDELDTYSSISHRIQTEDVYSVVETNFMPYGIESDQYAILGEIKAMKLLKNDETQEEIYVLSVETNGMFFDTCINSEDLLGEPAVGRRFKGIVWLQGTIEELDLL